LQGRPVRIGDPIGANRRAPTHEMTGYLSTIRQVTRTLLVQREEGRDSLSRASRTFLQFNEPI